MTRPKGIPAEETVKALMTRYGSDAAAAASRGVTRSTFFRWRKHYALEYRPVPVKAA